jgi:hypothetical protein
MKRDSDREQLNFEEGALISGFPPWWFKRKRTEWILTYKEIREVICILNEYIEKNRPDWKPGMCRMPSGWPRT